MFKTEHDGQIRVSLRYEEFLTKYGSFDLRTSAWKKALGDQTALRIAARNERIVSDYLSGKFTMRELGERESISHERVRQILSEHAPADYKNASKVQRQASKVQIANLEGRDQVFRSW